MATLFLMSFTEAVVDQLLLDGGVEIEPDSKNSVVEFVSARLGVTGATGSLVSTLAAALIACPQVEELFIDNDGLKDLITDLPFTALPRSAS